MRDVHSHILPGLDNGPRTMSGSLMMLSEAMQAGVTSIVCTPHCHDSRFRFEPAWQAFLQLKHRASAIPGAPELTMGFEVGYHKLKSLGMDAAIQLGNGCGEFLLELPTGALPLDWSHVVRQLQQRGFKVIISHPERCKEVQSDIQLARRFVDAGCELQIAAANMTAGFFSPERRTAKKLVQAGLVAHVASEAHALEDYELFAEAWEFYGMAEREQHAQQLNRGEQPASAAVQQGVSVAPDQGYSQPQLFVSQPAAQGSVVCSGQRAGRGYSPEVLAQAQQEAARHSQANPQAQPGTGAQPDVRMQSGYHSEPQPQAEPKRGKHAR